MNTKKLSDPFIILILGALTSITPFTIDMYLPAFKQIAEDFGTTPARVSLSVTSYFIGLAIGQMIYGPLLDRFGRAKPLYIGLTIFVMASVGCMQSQGINALVAFRFVQALGGCVAMVCAMTMVRDFFPVEKSANVFSLLILILGSSPLLAPTIGGFITVGLGWQWIFVILIILAVVIVAATWLFLPQPYKPDPSISLKAGPMLRTFGSVLRHPQFYTYAFAGAFSFATLFIYVAGSPVIFMEIHHVSPQAYGGIFALLSVGFIGASQLNILLTRYYSSARIFKTALTVQVITGIIFLVGALNNMYGLPLTIVLFFILLACIGLINPNANALALAPFTKNVGSASALIGSIQIGIAGLASGGVGLFNSGTIVPIVAMISAASIISITILLVGVKKIGGNLVVSSGAGEMLH